LVINIWSIHDARSEKTLSFEVMSEKYKAIGISSDGNHI